MYNISHTTKHVRFSNDNYYNPYFTEINDFVGATNVCIDNELSTLTPFTSFDALSTAATTCSPGTRKQVLETIQRWFDCPSAERILWLHGPIAAGKSTIAQTVANANRGDKVAAIFFFRSSPECNDGSRLFPTIAWQLASSFPAFKHHISHSLLERPDLPKRDVEIQFEKLIVRPFLALNTLTSSLQQRSPVVIIDGIDKCLDTNLQQRILKIITTDTDFPLRFFISSRREAHIEEMINSFEPSILRIDLSSFDDAKTSNNQSSPLNQDQASSSGTICDGLSNGQAAEIEARASKRCSVSKKRLATETLSNLPAKKQRKTNKNKTKTKGRKKATWYV